MSGSGTSPAKSAVSFRGSFSGYNKEDVNRYIEEMNIHFEETEADYIKIVQSQKKQIDEMGSQLEELKENIGEAESFRQKNSAITEAHDKIKFQLAELTKKKNDADTMIAVLNEKIERLDSENKELSERVAASADGNAQEQIRLLNEAIESLTCENAALSARAAAAAGSGSGGENARIKELSVAVNSLTEENRALTARLKEKEAVLAAAANAAKTAVAPASQEKQEKTAAKSEAEFTVNDSEKARMYDKVSRQVGTILIDAREISNKIISEAESRAEKIVKAAQKQAEAIRSDSDEKYRRATLYVNQTIKRMSSECMSAYIEHINNSRASLEKILNETTDEAEGLGSRFDFIIDNAEKELNAGIEKIIGENIAAGQDTV